MDLKKIKQQTEVNEGDIENLWFYIEYLLEKISDLEYNISELRNTK
jgi:hypothetical protein